MEIEKAVCNIDLALSIGSHDNIPVSHDVQLHNLFPHRLKEEEIGEEEEQETKRSRISIDGDEEDSLIRGARKKLRLTQEQAILLEDAFNLNNTLNSFQKQELAEKLKLRPRQVEVWFQNRRARNKLKQTEVDFQLLKKWCETLNEENQRLKKDLVDLKGSAFYLGSPKAASEAMKMTLCVSCARSTTSCKKSSSEDSSIA